jgi:hypothetical protein
MPTTYKAIREAQTAVLRAAAPAFMPAQRFVPWEIFEGPDFRAWCEATTDPFRVFHLVHSLDYNDEKYLDQQTESVVHTQVLLVAYPQQETFAGERMDDLIDEDITLLTKLLGERGYGTYSTLGSGEHKATRIDCQVESRPNAKILRLTFQLDYDRTIT